MWARATSATATAARLGCAAVSSPSSTSFSHSSLFSSPLASVFRVGASNGMCPVRAYHQKVLDHYNRPRNVGSMSKSDMDVGTGLVGAPACGDVMKLQIRVDPKNNTISDVKFKTFGCGSAIASSSYLTELVRGMTLEAAAKIRNTEIAKELCLPPVKLHCSMLAEDAIKSAITNYYLKNPNVAQRPAGTDLTSIGTSEMSKDGCDNGIQDHTNVQADRASDGGGTDKQSSSVSCSLL